MVEECDGCEKRKKEIERLKDLIRRFLKKEIGYRELKEEIGDKKGGVL
ncbi:MAG: hypothetical protein GWN86_10405 [Desulfobacterales bacterium]|nr:hypothetical protein [Desulfobacterales bacterium]